MKVLQINTVYGQGSTGRIVQNLETIMKKQGIEPFVAYGRGEKVATKNHYKVGNKLDFVFHVLCNFVTGRNGLASKYCTKKLLRWIDQIDPDIIHLHNIHGFYINYEMLFTYIKQHNIPIVWTLHDCWTFTGHCAYYDLIDCQKWKTGCYKCPVYRCDYPYSIFRDNSKENYERKKASFQNVQNMTLVTPSHWLANEVRQSFLKENCVEVIPNGINQKLFQRGKTLKERERIILAVANVWDKRKGLNDILRMSTMLSDEYVIKIIGLNKRQKRQIEKNYEKNVIPICRVNGVQEMAKEYKEALVFVNPTYDDNFPTTNLEALASGTPVITYATGGSVESVNEECGSIVPKGDIHQMIVEINRIASSSEITSNRCKEQSLGYRDDVQFLKYIDIYKKQ